MSDIKVICTSDKNVSITFTWDEFTPFHLVDIEGIYGIESNVVTSENTTTDGSTYQGATAKISIHAPARGATKGTSYARAAGK